MKKGASIGSTPFESLSYLVYQLSLHGLKMHWRKFICRILKKKESLSAGIYSSIVIKELIHEKLIRNS